MFFRVQICALELAHVESIVESFFFEELLMSASFDYFPFVDD